MLSQKVFLFKMFMEGSTIGGFFEANATYGGTLRMCE
jgi:hypothetical protein